MRPLWPLAGALFTVAAGCAGDGGAVSVRWALVDLQTGVGKDPRDFAAADGSGACDVPIRDPACNGATTSGRAVIHRLRLVVSDPVTGAPAMPGDDGRLIFRCRDREATTEFILPIGTFALSLQAFDPAAPDTDEGVTPPAAVRAIKKAEIVNLDVIRIGVHPLPTGADAQAAACGP